MGGRVPLRPVAFSRTARVALAASLCGLLVAGATAQTSREYDLKAVLLFNLAQFVEWPESAFVRSDSPLTIGVLGRDPFGRVLDATVQGETASRRSIVVERYQTLEQAQACHILFISSSERENLSRILVGLRGRPVLTVADFDGFSQSGGMIGLFKSPDNRIRLRVNLDAVKASSLGIRAKLLRVAEVMPSTRE